MLTPGSRVGQYEIVSSLGAGGMGEVYRARDHRLDREVALKVLPDAFAADRERIARFEREAKTLASLNHPHIAQVYGFEQADIAGNHVSALVMELVEGEDLSQRISHGPVSLEDAISIARQIAIALEAAHDHGIIHRDLKPANIKVGSDGTVKVLDFGLAKAIVASGPDAAPDVISSPTITTPAMTMRGVILGTAAYMAPEQAKGRLVDRRADIWAFGCVLYEMLTGNRPFVGDDVSDTLASVLKQDPEWNRLPGDTPDHLRRLLHRCLQRDPQKRLPHIGLARIEFDDPPQAVAVANAAPAWSGVWMAAAALLAIALAGSVVMWAPWQDEEPSSPLRLTLDPGVDGSFFDERGSSVVVSRDGRTLAYVMQSPGKSRQLYVRRLDQLTITPLPGTDDAAMPFFSPNGQWIGFFANGKLRKVAVGGGAAFTLADAASGYGAWWGDDDWIVFSATFLPAPLRRVRAVGGEVESFPAPPEIDRRVQRWPQMLPRGKGVLFSAHSRMNNFGNGLIVVQPSSGSSKVVHRGGYFARYLSSGHLTYISEGTLFAVKFDLDSLEMTGIPVPVVPNVLANPDNGSAHVSVADDGTTVLIAGPEISTAKPMMWIDRAGQTTPLLSKAVDWYSPTLSRDGRQLAFNIRTATSAELWVDDLERDALSRLRSTNGGADYPIWSPDGRRIAFSGADEPNKPNNLYWQRVDGSGVVERITRSDYPQRSGSWHPSGKWLIYHELHPKTINDLWLLPIEGDERTGLKTGAPQPFAAEPYAEVEPVFSPDGKWVAYWSNESGNFEVYVRPFPGPGGKWQVSSNGGNQPTWSPVQSELYFSTNDQQLMVVPYRVEGDEFRAERPRPWSETRLTPRGGGQRFYAMHPSGDRVVGMPAGNETATTRANIILLSHFFAEVRRATAANGQ